MLLHYVVDGGETVRRLVVVQLYLGLGRGTGDGYHIFSIFSSVLVLLLTVLSWLVHDSCCVCFIVSFCLSLPLVPLIRRF